MALCLCPCVVSFCMFVNWCWVEIPRSKNWEWISLLGPPWHNTTGRGAWTSEFYSSQFWRLKSKVKVPAGLVSSQASVLGLRMATFSLCPHLVFPSVFLCVRISSFKDTSHVGLGLTWMVLCLITSLKAVSKYSHTMRYLRLGLQHEFGGNTVEPTNQDWGGKIICSLPRYWEVSFLRGWKHFAFLFLMHEVSFPYSFTNRSYCQT